MDYVYVTELMVEPHWYYVYYVYYIYNQHLYGHKKSSFIPSETTKNTILPYPNHRVFPSHLIPFRFTVSNEGYPAGNKNHKNQLGKKNGHQIS